MSVKVVVQWDTHIPRRTIQEFHRVPEVGETYVAKGFRGKISKVVWLAGTPMPIIEVRRDLPNPIGR